MRYLPLNHDDRRAMLAAIGVDSAEALFADVPAAARHATIDLPPHKDELAVERAFGEFAGRNLSPATAPCFLGAGAYRHHLPATVEHLIQRGEFLTSYTPYQPEVTQGTLHYLFEFQTQVAMLTGMEIANASMYDGATACAEAAMMSSRITRHRRIVLSGGLHPHYRAVTETYARVLGLDSVSMPPDDSAKEVMEATLTADTACVIIQYPDFFGNLRNHAALASACHAAGALLVVVVTEIIALGLLTPPGDMGADIVVGEGQSLGNALSFGGPTVGLFATRKSFVRQMPGRLVGETVDLEGRRGFVLTLSAREQHIRREKATSNICTNAGLCALAFTVHLTLLGDVGLRRLAELNHARAVATADRLSALPGVSVLSECFFNEFTVRLPVPAEPVVEAMAKQGVLGGVPVSRLYPRSESLKAMLLVAATEMTSDEDIARLAVALEHAIR